MLFIAQVKSRQKPTAGVAAENVRDIEEDEKAGVRYQGISWTLGGYDTVVLFEAPDEKASMNMALRRLDRIKVRTLATVPGA